ncbi:hypothetical protein RclHR1_01870009 [Rhizophagus clarus]|uniref:HAT C-terminal dimerisation domain-containing protein n=1 Tax=Rhizophagus clarus TaxID=94130 RepID=A0A2Z6R1G9_9GLOM|nr:hypothetical protein RclHR1_01870009 [Rhizophagus clarus]
MDSHYNLPCRQTLKEKVNSLFSQRRTNVKSEINNLTSKVALTTDIWSFTFNNTAFLGITMHCITNDWKIKKCLLDFISLKGSHSAELILTKLTDVLQEFNISDRIISLTTDNGSNMLAYGREFASELKAGFFNFTFTHNRCAAHIINLAVKAGMKHLDSSIIKLRKFVNKIKNSQLLIDNLKNLANAIYEKLETYWNRHISNSSAISAILDSRYKLTTFNDQEERKNYVNHLQTLFSLYISNSQITPSTTNVTSQDSQTYFLNMINDRQDYAENHEYNEKNNYLSTPCDINADPLVWWNVYQKTYPILSLIAKDYLIIQATSVLSEQAFSVAGNTITQTRNRLVPETARATLCLKSWIENKLGVVNNEDDKENTSTINSEDSNSSSDKESTSTISSEDSDSSSEDSDSESEN